MSAHTTEFTLPLASHLQEDKVWREQIKPLLNGVPANVLDICQYGFTEILNNAIEHSEGQSVHIVLRRNATLQMEIADDGVGIFRKLTRDLHLDDERHAILELSKGKLTTDPRNHTGEGIFFASRVFDQFMIRSGCLRFRHDTLTGDWLIENNVSIAGTQVSMEISVASARTLQAIFDEYAAGDGDYGFTRTKVPLLLAQYGDENLVSRSQARRVLARFERFKEIVLDFHAVQLIGQAFADEIFRVYQQAHPRITLTWQNANAEIEKMIARVKSPS
ncbi:MAG: DUF4325 domain-containing protein [Chloroflexi bacterium]|nr:DUF4325 domain-containing protein [Chloroflexota bacterium]